MPQPPAGKHQCMLVYHPVQLRFHCFYKRLDDTIDVFHVAEGVTTFKAGQCEQVKFGCRETSGCGNKTTRPCGSGVNVTYKVRWEYAYYSSCLVWLLLSLYKWG